MVGQNQALGTQRVDGMDQVHQVLRVVQIGHFVAHLAQVLRQDTAAHAVLAAPQVDQNQRAIVHRVELRRQRAAHVGQGGKSGHDQGHRRGDFFGLSGLVLPLRAH